MATFFVDTTNGSNSNDGTAAATGGGHGPWATIAKAIGASGGAGTGGDTIYIAPGRYHESFSLGITPTVETKIIGDVHRSQAWAASTPNGPVIWDGWTTDEYTNTSNDLIVLNGKSFFTFEDLWLCATAGTILLGTTTGSHDITVRNCLLQGRWEGGGWIINHQGTANVNPNILIERCIMIGNMSEMCRFNQPKHSANYTANIEIRNCLMCVQTSYGLIFETSGSGVGFPGGISSHHNTFIGVTNCHYTVAAYQAGGIVVESNVAFGGNNASMTNNGTTEFASDNNRVISGGGIGSATVGKNDQGTIPYNYPYLFEWGQSLMWGLPPRPWGAPWGPSVILGWGEETKVATVDLLNRPRPSGGGKVAATASVTGTATAGAVGSLTDGGAAWTTNAFRGYVITITGGTGSGQRRFVKSNTGTVITPAFNFKTAPNNTSTYSIDPVGALKGVGAFEGHDTYLQGGSSNADGGSGDCLEILGPGNVRVRLAVPASATTITVKVKWDSNHGDTNKPRAIMLGQAAIGIAATEDSSQNWHESKTATGTAGSAYETLTFTSITPTAAGFVYILLQSRSAKGNGIAYFDTVGGV